MGEAEYQADRKIRLQLVVQYDASFTIRAHLQ
jgi:hypothetical protein